MLPFPCPTADPGWHACPKEASVPLGGWEPPVPERAEEQQASILTMPKLRTQPDVRRSRRDDETRRLYNDTLAEAFADMSKLAYCGPLPGLFAAVAQSCQSSHVYHLGAVGSCARAGFGVVPGTILEITAPDGSVTDGVFAYIAKVWPNMKKAVSFFKPGCMVVFRGSVENGVNGERDQLRTLVSGVTNCTGCTVHRGWCQR